MRSQVGPTVIVECTPLPLQKRATLYRDGIRVVVPAHRRTPPSALSPRVKTSNYLNMIVADQEVDALDPGAWAVLLDMDGNLAEGRGSNIFLVRDGALMTPRPVQVLPGISRQTVIELADELGIPCREVDLDLYDAYAADEAFLTSTSLCICPVRSINGLRVGGDPVFGPVTQRLIDAYARWSTATSSANTSGTCHEDGHHGSTLQVRLRCRHGGRRGGVDRARGRLRRALSGALRAEGRS